MCVCLSLAYTDKCPVDEITAKYEKKKTCFLGKLWGQLLRIRSPLYSRHFAPLHNGNTRKKSTVQEAERPISPLTVASIDHNAMQSLDILARGSAAITALLQCWKTHRQDIYIPIRPPLIESNKFMASSLQVVSVILDDKGNHKLK